MNETRLYAHVSATHKTKKKTQEWMLAKSKGDPISDQDLVRIYYGQPTKLDYRIKINHGDGTKDFADVGDGDDSDVFFDRLGTDRSSNGANLSGMSHHGGFNDHEARQLHDGYGSGQSSRRGFCSMEHMDRAQIASNQTSYPFRPSPPASTSAASSSPVMSPDVPTAAATRMDAQTMFNVLKGERLMQNLYQADGKFYALCCYHAGCGANTGRDAARSATAPNLTPVILQSHLREYHSERVCSEDAIEICKGDPISGDDISLIYHRQRSSVDARISVKGTTRKRPAPSSGEEAPTPYGMQGPSRRTSRRYDTNGASGPSSLRDLGSQPPARTYSPEGSDDLYRATPRPSNRTKRQRTSRFPSESESDYSIAETERQAYDKNRQPTVEDDPDEDWKPRT